MFVTVIKWRYINKITVHLLAFNTFYVSVVVKLHLLKSLYPLLQ